MSIWRIIKTVLNTILGILIIVFHEFCLENLPYVVGLVILSYGLEDVISWGLKGIVHEESTFFEGVILLILSFVMIFLVKDNFTVCVVIWGVWNLIREGREINESVKLLAEKKPGLLSIMESLIIIVLSTELIIEPVVHHAHVHIFLLGVELLFEALFPVYNYFVIKFYDRLKEKKKESS